MLLEADTLGAAGQQVDLLLRRLQPDEKRGSKAGAGRGCCAVPRRALLAEPALRPRGALLRRWTVLVVDGATLYFLLDSMWSDAFLRLAESTRSVICCRVTPLQKAQVVQLVKSKLNRVRGLTGNPEPERGGADSCPAHALVSVHRSA